MKKLIYIILLIFTYSCEDVIDLDLPTSEPRLVIDASIDWLKGTSGNEQSIKLSLTAPFFDVDVPPANGAMVIITDSNNNIFEFMEDGNTGIYRNNTFLPEINGEYSLTVTYNEETYEATEILKPVSEITRVEQNL